MIFSLSTLGCQLLLEFLGLVKVSKLLRFLCSACLSQLEVTISQQTSWSSDSYSDPTSGVYPELCNLAICLLHVQFQPLTPTLRQLLICFIINLLWNNVSISVFFLSFTENIFRFTLYFIYYIIIYTLHYTIYQQFLLSLFKMSLY